MRVLKILHKPIGRRFVIADVHGCSRTLQALVREQLKLTRDDQLFLLGDYINRGPDSAGVIEFIMNLQARNYQVFALMGNHEEMLLESDWQATGAVQVPVLQKRTGLVDENRKILPHLRPFFEHLPYYCELEDFYLVHAGFNFAKEHPFEDFKSMLRIRKFSADETKLTSKRIVHGHEPTPLEEIKKNISHRRTIIPLDNGCYKSLARIYEPYLGSLCALNLDSFELLIQANLDR